MTTTMTMKLNRDYEPRQHRCMTSGLVVIHGSVVRTVLVDVLQ